MNAAVKGTGAGACAAAAVLLASGWNVSLVRARQQELSRASWITVNEETVALLYTLFGTSLQLPVKRWIAGRAVRTGRTRSLALVRSGGALMSLSEFNVTLLTFLRRCYGTRLEILDEVEDNAPPHLAAAPHGFGHVLSTGARLAWETEVELAAPLDHTVFEVVPQGWMYLVPGDAGIGHLMCVTFAESSEPFLAMIGDSIEIADRVAGVGRILSPLPAAAEFRWPVDCAEVLHCGAGIFRWDSICGDGTGASLRSGILAAAGLESVHQGESFSAVRAHLVRRCAVAFSAHAAACEGFYRNFSLNAHWDAEIRALERARVNINQAAGTADWEFHLDNCKLIRRGTVGNSYRPM